jgi:DNA-directed RNA polymerase subunit RPC12/RpoP
MDISFNCTNCGQRLEVDERGAGISTDCPKCGKPVYVPSRPTVSEAQAPMRVILNPTEKPGALPPFIEGSLHCIFIAAVLMILGLFFFRAGSIAGMVLYTLAIPFHISALLCAIYGICKGFIRHGLGLLAGVAVLYVLFLGGPLWGMAKLHTTTSPMMEDMQKQMEEMQQMFRQK